jgi:hypothetical protein
MDSSNITFQQENPICCVFFFVSLKEREDEEERE